jgi:transposase
MVSTYFGRWTPVEHSVDLVPNLIRSKKSNGRCVYDKAAKRELVRRCLQPGVSLARTAMEHGVNANLVRKWVRVQTGSSLTRRRRALPALPGASLVAVRTNDPAPVNSSSADGYLELVVAGVTIRVHGRIDAHSLSVALDCLARRA